MQREAAEQARLGLAAPAARGERPGIASGQQSDHLAMVAAYEGWKKAVGGGGAPGKRAGREHCRKHFLNQQVSTSPVKAGILCVTGYWVPDRTGAVFRLG